MPIISVWKIGENLSNAISNQRKRINLPSTYLVLEALLQVSLCLSLSDGRKYKLQRPLMRPFKCKLLDSANVMFLMCKRLL